MKRAAITGIAGQDGTYLAHGLPAVMLRTSLSPSPRPSPSGRGRILRQRFELRKPDFALSSLVNRGVRACCSLSLGERVRVRGKNTRDLSEFCFAS